jgi:lysozyme
MKGTRDRSLNSSVAKLKGQASPSIFVLILLFQPVTVARWRSKGCLPAFSTLHIEYEIPTDPIMDIQWIPLTISVSDLNGRTILQSYSDLRKRDPNLLLVHETFEQFCLVLTTMPKKRKRIPYVPRRKRTHRQSSLKFTLRTHTLDAKISRDGVSQMANFTYSESGVALTKEYEGLELKAYQDQVGVWTIGYGHTGSGVHGGLTITQDQADQLLLSDIAASVTCVNRAVTAAINQNQFDALVDFVFNLGCAALLSSTLLRDLNAGDFESVAGQFLLWDHAGGVVLPGLLRRRQAESDLFQT